MKMNLSSLLKNQEGRVNKEKVDLSRVVKLKFWGGK